MKSLQPTTKLVSAFFMLMLFSACRNFNWAPTDALEKVSTTPPNTVVAPVFAPAGGSYNATQNVTLTTSTSGATICYRNDGTNADCDSATGTCFAGSTTYVGAISVPASITLNAMACKATMNNSAIATAVFTIDSTAPVISATSPAAATYVTNTQVSYTLSESCGTGSITWTRTSGSPDPGSPRVQALTGAELTAGTHSAITLTNNPALVSGAVYDIAFNCTDAAGNAATTVTAAGVTFDNVVPVISGVAPTTGTFRTNTQVSYTLSEDCQTGNITWTRTGGVADGASPHVQTLAGLELTQGTKTNLTLGNNPALVSGAIYTIDFNCQDFAGQTATTVTSTGVTFDNVAPIISGVAPLDSAFVSTTQVSYDLTEVCATASITWTRTGGSADVGSPHVQALTAGEMTAITHTNITITNNPTLADGAVYQMDFNCTDAAGNVATTVTRTNITYDPSAVVISGVTPASSAFRNNTQVSYTLSENCASGNVTWTRTGGNADPGSPRVQALAGAELTAGTKSNITLFNNPPLVDGAVYSVQFNCTDFAANASTPITVTNVTYDFTAPTITGTAPATSSFRNNNLVSFTYSETCATATITWTHTGGTADPGSPHVQSVTGADLNAGAHNGIIIANNPTLADGGVYTMDYACSDAAGNAATVISNTGITFDYTAPTISIQNLRNNSTVHTGHVIGPANDNVGVTVVEFSLDGGALTAASYVAPDYKFALPMGASTWRDRTTHTIQVQARDAAGNVTTSPTISVRKGNNRDVNGDGYEDVAVSAHLHDTNQGAIHVFYGTAGGIPDNITSTTPVLQSTIAQDGYGRNSALADFNSDGFADLAVAAPCLNATLPGNVKVYHGQAGGLNTTVITSLVGVSNDDKFGTVVIAADMDNDGYSDLVVSAASWNANTQVGRVYIYRSTGAMISTTIWRTLTGEGAAHRFGTALAAGDFNNNNGVDLAVGAVRYNAGTFDGRVYLFSDVATLGALVTATAGQALVTGTGAEQIGSALAVGDMNGDGYSDLVISSVFYATDVGRAYIHYGGGGGLPGSPGATITGSGTPNYFTTSISVRDLNSDGYDDLVSGAHGNGIATGATYIFWGAAAQLGVLTTGSGGVSTITGEDITSQFGRGIGVSDINGDGFPDLIVGAPMHSTQQGRVYILYSSSSGPVETSAGAASNTILAGQTAQVSQFATSISR